MTPSQGSDTMVDRAAALPETKERRCPACQGGAITPANHLLAFDNVIKEEFQCADCASAFWVVRLDGKR